MNEYAKSEGLGIFNPSSMFETHLPEVLLMQGGKDLNHYAKNMLDTVGEIQLQSVMKILEWLRGILFEASETFSKLRIWS